MNRTLTTLSFCIVFFSVIAASIGIFNQKDHGEVRITTVRGTKVKLYGKGVYHQMSAEVAPQGIAQDVVTLFIAIPFLIFSLILCRKDSLRGKVLLTGLLSYFLVTYLFFTLMAMYNQLFLLWVVLLSLSFYAFIISFNSFRAEELMSGVTAIFPVRSLGIFLIVNSLAIGFLWLSIVVPALIHGSIPVQVEHYTTLVVQAIDLAILLPASFLAGFKLINRNQFGFKLAAVYIIFLTLLMTALTAKIAGMAWLGYNVIPVIFIIPVFNLLSLYFMIKTVQGIR